LFFDILLDHLVCDATRVYGKIAARPEMSAPELFLQLWKFGQKDARAYSFQLLHDLADVLGWAIGNERMDVIVGDFPRDNFDFVLYADVAQNIPGLNRDSPYQDPLPVFRNPHQMGFQIRLCISFKLVKSHIATVYKLFFA
jgi:hypothetical protein